MDMEIATPTPEASLSKKPKHDEVALIEDTGNSASLGGSTSATPNSDNANGSNSDLSYHGDENDEEDGIEDDCEVSDFGDNDDYMYDDNDDDDNDDDYLSMQAHFDNVDLPPGVEATVSWLKDSVPISSTSIPTDSSQVNPKDRLGNGEASASLPSNPVIRNAVASSSASVSSGLGSIGKEKEENGDEIIRNYKQFKHFDVVDDYSDHHYTNMGFKGQQPPSAWTKKIQDEWRILEKDLPDMIYVRAFESRMDLLRAVIVGPQGTPYHDGLFVFDIFFPTNYPNEPPMVYYYSGGLRLNPNLYDCGKVCLSLLNTWSGQTNEKWMPKASTMLQVLVSIQALILNAKPFFNEPGYDKTYVGEVGEKKSIEYNNEVFILSLKTMMYTLRRPPKHFEDLVIGHFRAHAHDILSACKAYMEGAPVGSVVKGKVKDGVVASKNRSPGFQSGVSRMMNGLISNFTKNGATDCEQFRTSR